MTETSKVYAREVSMVPVYALLLFGGHMTVLHEEGALKLDGWATFRAPARIATLVGWLGLYVLHCCQGFCMFRNEVLKQPAGCAGERSAQGGGGHPAAQDRGPRPGHFQEPGD